MTSVCISVTQRHFRRPLCDSIASRPAVLSFITLLTEPLKLARELPLYRDPIASTAFYEALKQTRNKNVRFLEERAA